VSNSISCRSISRNAHPDGDAKALSGREIPVAVPKSLQESANELALKIVLAVVGLLFIALGNL
jgi:hypothetical protein